MLTHRGLQVKEEKQAKKAKLASKTKLSFADDVEEEAVCRQTLLHIPSLLVCMKKGSASIKCTLMQTCPAQLRQSSPTMGSVALHAVMWQDCRT